MPKNKFDFSGYATKANLKCTDGRIIRKDAFKHNDGQKVPLVWQHVHNDPTNILGHAILENREDGVYAYGVFNDTDAAKHAKTLVEHGDITALSIHANDLKQKGSDVIHGVIREVSLVVAGANPEALIDNLSISHGDGSFDTDESEAIIYTGEAIVLGGLEHQDTTDEKTMADDVATETKDKETINHSKDSADETMEEVLESMTDKQKNVCYALVTHALGEKSDDDNQNNDEVEHSNKGGKINMKKNIFDKTTTTTTGDALSHADVMTVLADAKRMGSLKESVISHGITNIDYLFPDAVNVDKTPGFITRDMGWVKIVMGGVHNTPFSRIKSMFADITADDARAKGYIKGHLKVEEVFSLLKRTTSPTTIYKKQKLDRDDVVDITDFDVVAWLKAEMRIMLDEEIARAILVGDGRLSSSDDKIKEDNIRPIWNDADLYTIKALFVAALSADQRAKDFIKTTIKARKNYKGSGNPSLFMTEDMLTDCLLMEDTTGRIIYDSIAKLATTLRVANIITTPVMESLTRVVGPDTLTLHGIVVNLDDYNVGADKGGAVNMFDDFDIDYNAQKYLIETRASGALIKPYAAIAIESKPAPVG